MILMSSCWPLKLIRKETKQTYWSTHEYNASATLKVTVSIIILSNLLSLSKYIFALNL